MIINNSNISLSKIVQVIPLNEHNEINYTATIQIESFKEAVFYYAVVFEKDLDSPNIEFLEIKKLKIFTEQNTDNVLKKKYLLLKSPEQVDVNIIIKLDTLLSTTNNLETVETQKLKKGLYPAQADNPTKTENDVPWYRNTKYQVLIGLVIVLIIAMFIKSKKSNSSGSSLFID